MKLFFALSLIAISSNISAAAESYLSQLPIVETFMGGRRTNVGLHDTLYPDLNLGLVVNCHPYNPTDVAGDSVPACAAHPLVVRYEPDICRLLLPEFVRARLDSAGPACQLFLNVQDNPWNGTPIQLRAHAFSDFFPAMNAQYLGVSVFVCRGDGTVLLNSTDTVYPHGGIASPSNFAIAGLDHTHTEDFYSIVTYMGRNVITRHILLTVPSREAFGDALCVPTASDRSSNFFSSLLGSGYADFLNENAIV